MIIPKETLRAIMKWCTRLIRLYDNRWNIICEQLFSIKESTQWQVYMGILERLEDYPQQT
jgi:hypothetical protein